MQGKLTNDQATKPYQQGKSLLHPQPMRLEHITPQPIKMDFLPPELFLKQDKSPPEAV
jgi:hypothetical protein